MTREEQNCKLKAFITCLKCEVSGKCCDLNCSTQYDAGNMGEIIENLEAISKALEQEPRWIPVEERLPDIDDEVLCWYEYYHWSQEKVLPEYGLGRYLRETSAWFGEVANGHEVRVIAWMPLPKPYKAESEA